MDYPGGTSDKEHANAGDLRDAGSIPGLGRSSGGGHGNPFQYSCLENPMNRGAWQAMVCRVAGSKTSLKQLSTIVIIIEILHPSLIYLDQYPLNVANNNI